LLKALLTEELSDALTAATVVAMDNDAFVLVRC
jgi:hypothetical protein